MKIQNDAGNSAAPLSGDAALAKLSRKDQTSDLAASPEKPVTDTVETSSIAQHLEADPARLERLREAVRNGAYAVAAHEVSAKLVDEHLNKRS
jgi:anti-sigma28 factor (negative regulator of flagellin synthesis)